jgi:hypothetical protein
LSRVKSCQHNRQRAEKEFGSLVRKTLGRRFLNATLFSIEQR